MAFLHRLRLWYDVGIILGMPRHRISESVGYDIWDTYFLAPEVLKSLDEGGKRRRATFARHWASQQPDAPARPPGYLSLSPYWVNEPSLMPASCPPPEDGGLLGLFIDKTQFESRRDQSMDLLTAGLPGMFNVLLPEWGYADRVPRLGLGKPDDPRRTVHWVDLFSRDREAAARRLEQQGSRLTPVKSGFLVQNWTNPYEPPAKKALAALEACLQP